MKLGTDMYCVNVLTKRMKEWMYLMLLWGHSTFVHLYFMPSLIPAW